jgi:hypothetical protein
MTAKKLIKELQKNPQRTPRKRLLSIRVDRFGGEDDAPEIVHIDLVDSETDPEVEHRP